MNFPTLPDQEVITTVIGTTIQHLMDLFGNDLPAEQRRVLSDRLQSHFTHGFTEVQEHVLKEIWDTWNFIRGKLVKEGTDIGTPQLNQNKKYSIIVGGYSCSFFDTEKAAEDYYWANRRSSLFRLDDFLNLDESEWKGMIGRATINGWQVKRLTPLCCQSIDANIFRAKWSSVQVEFSFTKTILPGDTIVVLTA